MFKLINEKERRIDEQTMEIRYEVEDDRCEIVVRFEIHDTTAILVRINLKNSSHPYVFHPAIERAMKLCDRRSDVERVESITSSVKN